MDSKEFIDEVKDDISIMPHQEEHSTWCVKTEDALKAIDMAKEEAKQEIEENTLYSIKKGDFVTIYNAEEDKYVVGKLERITHSAFYFVATDNDDNIYARDKWTIKVEI